MAKELIINVGPNEVSIALLEDKGLVEFIKEPKDRQFCVGDMYLGRIKRVMPGLNAAFVDIGSEKDAFLHYLDLGPQVKSLMKFAKILCNGGKIDPLLSDFPIEKDIDKTGKVTAVLAANQWIPVQIMKEPISNKGPRLSSEISIPGRFLVLVPFSNDLAISQKIKDPAERARLKKMIGGFRPKNFGVIIRTVAEGQNIEDIQEDLKQSLDKWKAFAENLINSKPPKRVLGEMDRSITILRDLLNDNFSGITVDDPEIYQDIKQYLSSIASDKEGILKLSKGKTPILEQFEIDRQIKSLFGKTVSIPGGSYLIIEHTEALHVIDVNSGVRIKKEDNQEETAFQVNLEAAKEVARQLRLRDMGGIIVVDFIDMHNTLHKRQLFEALKTEMDKDRAKHTILPPSKFGLIEITRQRVRPETQVEVAEACPTCQGSGQVKPSLLIVDDLEANLKYLVQEQNEKGITIQVHPFVAAFLTKGLFSIRWKWYRKYKQWVKVESNQSFSIYQYSFLNNQKFEIQI